MNTLTLQKGRWSFRWSAQRLNGATTLLGLVQHTYKLYMQFPPLVFFGTSQPDCYIPSAHVQDKPRKKTGTVSQTLQKLFKPGKSSCLLHEIDEHEYFDTPKRQVVLQNPQFQRNSSNLSVTTRLTPTTAYNQLFTKYLTSH